MGNQISGNHHTNFEDVQYAVDHAPGYLLINTLSENEQSCLIKNTIHANNEEGMINHQLQARNTRAPIIVYGKHANDRGVVKKYEQLVKMGFSKVYIYQGGLFEWLLLQDIYGADEFPTTASEIDILKYKPGRALHNHLLEYA